MHSSARSCPLSGLGAYLLVAVLAAGEAAAFTGLVLPGEAALLFGGVLASQGHVSLPIMIAVAILAAILGDSVGTSSEAAVAPASSAAVWVARSGRPAGPPQRHSAPGAAARPS